MPDLVSQITGALSRGTGGRDLYSELLVARELYGHLLTLGMRPFSEGNDLALIDAQRQIADLLTSLRGTQRAVFTDARLQLIEVMLRQTDVVPIAEVAQAIVRPIRELFALRWADDGYVHLRDYCMWPPLPLDRVIVSVGPTIGIGDEILMARALIERAARCGVALEVESARPSIWTAISAPPVRALASPPGGTPERLAALNDASRRRTMVLRGDFLPSDPSAVPWYLPRGLGGTARWTFGNASAIIVDAVNRTICHVDYPAGMPASRTLEARWVAARLLPVPAAAPDLTLGTADLWRRPRNGANPVLLMQVLTSKPSLMLAPAFYAECLAHVRSTLGSLPDIRLLAGPTASTQAICQAIAAEIRARMPDAAVELVGPLGFDDIGRELEHATALFGPDTFTGHLAAIRGVPQVTLQLAEHRPWLNPSTPTFAVAVGDDRLLAVRQAADRLRFVLLAARERFPDVQRSWAREWCECLQPVRLYVDAACDAPPPEHPRALAPFIARVSELLRTWERAGLGPTSDAAPPPAVDLDRYPSPVDAWRAVATWYVHTASSDVSGAAHVLHALS
jgi:hypothetical protein